MASTTAANESESPASSVSSPSCSTTSPSTQQLEQSPKKQQSSNKKFTSPFSDFNISSTDILDSIPRGKCSKCQKKGRFFCYKCLIQIDCPPGSIPELLLPIKLDVIKHELERDGKSTALHSKILAPHQASVYNWKSRPDYSKDLDRTLLLFPGDDAKTLSEIDAKDFDRLVVIDGTWPQAQKMVRDDDQLRSMRRVTIAPHRTMFWRYQKKESDHLATIEAIYFLLREYQEAFLKELPTVFETRPLGNSTTATLANLTTSPSTSSESTPSTDADNTTQNQQQGQQVKLYRSPHNELIPASMFGPYTNQMDDMMWFYKYFYDVIQKYYRERDDGKTFTFRHTKGYIQYDSDEGEKVNNGDNSVVVDEPSTTEATSAPVVVLEKK